MLCYKALVYVLSFKPACAERPPTWLIRFTSTLKKNKKHDNQTAFAGSEKKIIQEWAQRHVAYCPIFT